MGREPSTRKGNLNHADCKRGLRGAGRVRRGFSPKGESWPIYRFHLPQGKQDFGSTFSMPGTDNGFDSSVDFCRLKMMLDGDDCAVEPSCLECRKALRKLYVGLQDWFQDDYVDFIKWGLKAETSESAFSHTSSS